MRRNAIRSEAGFTLLEIMVALAILSISLVTLLTAHGRAMTMTDDAAKLTDAVTMAREEMERMQMEPLPEAGVSEKRRRDDFPWFQWRAEVKETPFPNVWEVGISVFRAGDDRETPITGLRAYVAR
ncbi:MAG: prepilin-type N-terminal cleavage/methylation domain-containing protein [Nitrospinae bacterium]|nr:prepilin-type N-terminal cleavage/methylation domain-containing protein [Nitrospinota bacterium]